MGCKSANIICPSNFRAANCSASRLPGRLVNDPSILLADEPTGNLDTKSSEIIMRELSEIHQKGNTIIMVTHNPDLTVWADRIIMMVDGRIAKDSKAKKKEVDPNKKRPLGTFGKALQAAAEVTIEEAEDRKPARLKTARKPAKKPAKKKPTVRKTRTPKKKGKK